MLESEDPPHMFWTVREAALRTRGPTVGPWTPGSTPLASRASGSQVWDEGGRRYIDLMMGFGTVLLGHAHPEVDEAVVTAIRSGVSRTLHTRDQIELADELLDALDAPDTSDCLFARTGSDATSAAVRIARAYTGHDRVIRVGYNGWHDWSSPRAAGVPSAVRSLTTVVPINDIEQALVAFDRAKADLAAVVLMPFEIDPPTSDFITLLAERTRQHGGLLILDEVRTGFRLGRRGAAGHFDIEADLYCYSKSLANGYALSAVVGDRQLLDVIADVSLSSAYFRSADGIAAARATLAVLQREPVVDHCWSSGRRLMERMAESAARLGLSVGPVGLPPMLFHKFDLSSTELDRRAEEQFATECIRNGVIVHPTHHWFMSSSLTPAMLGEVAEVMHHSYSTVAASI